MTQPINRRAMFGFFAAAPLVPIVKPAPAPTDAEHWGGVLNDAAMEAIKAYEESQGIGGAGGWDDYSDTQQRTALAQVRAVAKALNVRLPGPA